MSQEFGLNRRRVLCCPSVGKASDHEIGQPVIYPRTDSQLINTCERVGTREMARKNGRTTVKVVRERAAERFTFISLSCQFTRTLFFFCAHFRPRLHRLIV